MASVYRVELLSTTALTAVNNGTAKVLEAHSDKFVGWLNVSVNDGATTVAAKIQHSADGTNWEDLASFTNVVNVTSTEAIQIALAVLPHVRSVVTPTGTPAATVAVALYHDKVK